VILKNEFKEKWPDTELQLDEQTKSTISAAASKRISQSKGFGYLGYEINSPLMYLNRGELTRIIDAKAYWPIFEPFFRGKKEIIRNKLDEIAAIRNALAHFRPLKPDDIEVIKQNVKHVFLGIEQCLTEMTQTHRTVPTNTEHAWYKELSTLGSSLCDVRLFQNNAGTWIRLQIEYTCAMLQNSGPGDFRSFTVSNLISPAILKAFPGLARHCIFATEIVPHSEVTRDTAPAFKKIISATLSRATINNHHAEINASMGKYVLDKAASARDIIAA